VGLEEPSVEGLELVHASVLGVRVQAWVKGGGNVSYPRMLTLLEMSTPVIFFTVSGRLFKAHKQQINLS
jgi:hypothetical protein